MAKRDDDMDPAKFTVAQLKEIVAAGMPISDARELLEDGYRPEDVLELAHMQAAQKQAAQASALNDAARVAADHTEKVRNPSNKIHPGISTFSYPQGDVAKPKPVPPFEFMYNGYPCHKFTETEHWRECELFVAMGAVAPGIYPVIRKDHTTMDATVEVTRAADGKPSKVEVRFPVSRDDKPLIPAKAVVLYQIVHANQKPLKRLFLEAMNEWLSITLGEPVEV